MILLCLVISKSCELFRNFALMKKRGHIIFFNHGSLMTNDINMTVIKRLYCSHGHGNEAEKKQMQTTIQNV